jgi:hypothetical protein
MRTGHVSVRAVLLSGTQSVMGRLIGSGSVRRLLAWCWDVSGIGLLESDSISPSSRCAVAGIVTLQHIDVYYDVVGSVDLD